MTIRGLLSTAILLAATTVASAQIPRTVNYQGRAADAAGAPVTGTRSMTLVVYDAQTGGAELFRETQSVEFSSTGIFSVAIGSTSPGGMPPALQFDKPCWLGVTIAGFNGGTEITPRYPLRANPYSFWSARSTLADRSDSSRAAYLADSAMTIPAMIGGSLDRDHIAVLDIVSDGATDAALRLEGVVYALITEGIDSTSEHYIAGGYADEDPADVGGLYRDNVPMAWGVIAQDATVVSEFGIESVSYNDTTGVYEIVLDHSAQMLDWGGGTSGSVPSLSPMITVGGLDNNQTQETPPVAIWNYKSEAGGFNNRTIEVRLLSSSGFSVQASFAVQVFGRPE